jgi:hypothetical protein
MIFIVNYNKVFHNKLTRVTKIIFLDMLDTLMRQARTKFWLVGEANTQLWLAVLDVTGRCGAGAT